MTKIPDRNAEGVGPVIDPTKNVLNLVEAAVKRVNDLHEEVDRRYNQRFLDNEKFIHFALEAQKEAVLKAEHAIEKRLEGLNELRNMLTDILSKTVSRVEWEAQHQEIVRRVTNLDLKISELTNTTMSRQEGVAHAANDLALHADITSRLSDLDKRISVKVGEDVGHKDTAATIRANIAMGIALAGFLAGAILWFAGKIVPNLGSQPQTQPQSQVFYSPPIVAPVPTPVPSQVPQK